MKLFALVIVIGIVLFAVYKFINNWLDNSPTFPHDDPCWGCNRGSCIEPTACPVVTDWDGISEVNNEETF